MKNWLKILLSYIAGFVSCFFVIMITGMIFGGGGGLSGFTPLQEKGKCINGSSFTIMQAHEPGIALAYSGNDIFNSQVVLFIDENGKLFYDGEVIKIPAQNCARQVGTYQYTNREDIVKTVPAVIIDSQK